MTGIEWSGKTTSYHHKHNDTPNPPDVKRGVRKAWFLDAQWSDCPVEVENEVRLLWQVYELVNDNSMIKTSIVDLLVIDEDEKTSKDFVNGEWIEVSVSTKAIVQYLREQGVGDNELVIIHWWW